MTEVAPDRPQRVPLSRARIVRAALGYIDEHGLDALSMHKLGAALDVKGMSLYNHVTNKDDVLDGVVELLWTEVEESAPAEGDWQDALRSFAHAMRDMVRRHPDAAPLLASQSYMAQPALRVVKAHAAALVRGGMAQEHAYAILRTITSYTLGSAFNEVSWSPSDPACGTPNVADLLRPGTPDDLAAVADIFCGQANYDDQFQLGLDLMLRGITNTDEGGCGKRQ